jgi:hypothetical protein
VFLVFGWYQYIYLLSSKSMVMARPHALVKEMENSD